jgi:hypothetical protein
LILLSLGILSLVGGLLYGALLWFHAHVSGGNFSVSEPLPWWPLLFAPAGLILIGLGWP